MPQITLSQALKLKSRLTKEIRELTSAIERWNSVVIGAERALDIETAYNDLKKKTEKLARLKAQIQRANSPIQEKVFQLSELKGLNAFLARLNTAQGPAPVGYSGEMAEYKAALNGAYVRQEQQRITALVDQTQDEIDAFNATTLLDVD